MKYVSSVREPIGSMCYGATLVVRFKRDNRTPSIVEKIERIEVSRKGTHVVINRRYVFDNYVGEWDRAETEDERAKRQGTEAVQALRIQHAANVAGMLR